MGQEADADAATGRLDWFVRVLCCWELAVPAVRNFARAALLIEEAIFQKTRFEAAERRADPEAAKKENKAGKDAKDAKEAAEPLVAVAVAVCLLAIGVTDRGNVALAERAASGAGASRLLVAATAPNE
ncbi:hypothetical protein PG997_001974 [Apiospora hydei]|uniref:Uncharacterized protein n=1 Tax=Apiospora hydei TaxID=1337664 RepID=A0ABR1X872_9PEZI